MITDLERLSRVNKKLNSIPHLNLTKFLPQPPLRQMLVELFQFNETDFYPYITGFQDQKAQEHMASNWKGMCLIDSTTSGRHNIDYWCTENNFEKLEFRYDADGNPVYSPTDVGELCPQTLKYLYDIAEKPGKTRLSRMVANGGNASWHSHRKLADGGDEKFVKKEMIKYILHIPLITNATAYMGVSETDPSKDPDAKKIWQKYNFGEIWIFNNYWYHNAVNLGKDHRDHIMMYVNPDDDKLIPIIEKAIDEYQGPYIENKELR
jgi:hypothetical protein